MTIPQAAIDAACDVYHRPGRMITNTAVGSHYDRMTAALEAAMPHLRKQVAEGIRAEAAKRAGTAGWDTAFHNLGLVTAARIAENGPGQ